MLMLLCLGSTPAGMPDLCGDGIVTDGEMCDDGNTETEDGCSAICTEVIDTCPDGITGFGETCDDGNTAYGDGCRPAAIEYGCTSRGTIHTACTNPAMYPFRSCDTEECGNGFIDCLPGNNSPGGCDLPSGREACDDSNSVKGDGCNGTCTSNETCGNAASDAAEQCDDGNTTNGDGCSDTCLQEAP
jgi:cysteine-rich repeat protein